MTSSPRLPAPRGPLSDRLVAGLRRSPTSSQALADCGTIGSSDPWGEDLQVALYVAHELRYRGFAGVDPDWELEAPLLDLARRAGDAFLAAVREEVGPVSASTPADVGDALVGAATAEGPSLSRWIDEYGALDHLREFAVHRSAYQLKEADPHSLALPRLPAGRAKAAFVEIQAEEYGGGEPGESHQELFAATMRGLGLDDRYGAYVDLLPASTLATVNLLSLFGGSRRWLGACVGHLALFEMTSVGPMGRYARAVRRMTGNDAAARFYDVHVLADQHHERLALHGMAVPFAAEEPALAVDVAFGAGALALVEGRFSDHLLTSWRAGRTSLRQAAAHGDDRAAA